VLDRSTNRRAGDAAARQVHSCKDRPAGNSQPATRRQLIHAEPIGSNECRADGLVAVSPTPVLLLCPLLIEAGHDANTVEGMARRGPVPSRSGLSAKRQR
jgi:hypothetical protein